MISASDLRGLMAMIPSFTTADGGDLCATHTINVDELKRGVDQIIADGANVIATTGSFGEPQNLLQSEFETLVHETVKAVNGRVPVIIGVITPNTRQSLANVRIAEAAGADAVMCAVPYYFESTVENALTYYRDIADAFPKLGMFIYHNPMIHKLRIPVSAVLELAKLKNFVGMKDSHRTPEEFDTLMSHVRDQLSVFVLPNQYVDYAAMGAAGIWSIDAWMGPEPITKLLKLVERKRIDEARQLAHEIMTTHTEHYQDLKWRETGSKLAVKYAGYVDPGPLRRPYVHVPPEVDAQLKRRGEYWRTLRQRCREAS